LRSKPTLIPCWKRKLNILNKFQPDFFSIENYKNSLYPFRQQLGNYYGYSPSKVLKGTISKFRKIGEDRYGVIYRVWIEVVKGVHAYGIDRYLKISRERHQL
jgi:hypothetical protein